MKNSASFRMVLNDACWPPPESGKKEGYLISKKEIMMVFLGEKKRKKYFHLHWDLNPRPSDHKPSALTILPPGTAYIVYVISRLYSKCNCEKVPSPASNLYMLDPYMSTLYHYNIKFLSQFAPAGQVFWKFQFWRELNLEPLFSKNKFFSPFWKWTSWCCFIVYFLE